MTVQTITFTYDGIVMHATVDTDKLGDMARKALRSTGRRSCDAGGALVVRPGTGAIEAMKAVAQRVAKMNERLAEIYPDANNRPHLRARGMRIEYEYAYDRIGFAVRASLGTFDAQDDLVESNVQRVAESYETYCRQIEERQKANA